jgi:hypothetical protein
MTEIQDSDLINEVLKPTQRKERKERKFLKDRWHILLNDDEGNAILDKSYKSHVDIIKCELNQISSRQLLYYHLKGYEKIRKNDNEEKTSRKLKYNIKITKLN